MAEGFRYHQGRPSDDEVVAGIQSGVVAFDANVLLNFYEADPKTRRKRVELLGMLGDSLFIPFQVKEEFHRRRKESARSVSKEYAALRTAVAELKKVGAAFGRVNKATSKSRDPVSVSKARNVITECIHDLLGQIENLEREDPHIVDLAEDPVLAGLVSVFEGHVAEIPSARKIAKRVREFVEIRVPLGIPPGFRDVTKGDEAQAAGDYLIWSELIGCAKSRQVDLVFVTDDLKSDWWVEGSRENPTAAHPSLIAEFGRETAGRRYFQVTANEFFARAVRALGDPPVDRTSIDMSNTDPYEGEFEDGPTSPGLIASVLDDSLYMEISRSEPPF
ncbi:PIN-like domain-containing protein [Isoptericola sp. NPDC019571]|uniref:PIN-like domain-containing protein n=1 Tax=Isoptericola sp. NPDC019571 TaxID=3364008 RepID=UPI0037B0A151